MNKFIFFLSLLLPVFGFSQIPEFEGQGKLIILRIVPGDKTAKLFIVGRKAAEIDLKKDAKVLSVRLGSAPERQELRINDRGDYYEVNDLPKNKTPYVLDIRAQVKGKIENIQVPIDLKKP